MLQSLLHFQYQVRIATNVDSTIKDMELFYAKSYL